jgi:hypothetical protein
MHCCPAVFDKENGENLARCQVSLYFRPSVHENCSEEALDCLVATNRHDYVARFFDGSCNQPEISPSEQSGRPLLL